jgi:hypothetical protein
VACSLDDSNLVVESRGTGGAGGANGSGTDIVAGSTGSEDGTGGTSTATGGTGGTSRATGGSGGTGAGGKAGSGGMPNTGGTIAVTGGGAGTSVGGKGGTASSVGGTGGTAIGSGGVGGVLATGGNSGTEAIRFHFESDEQEWRDLTFARCTACTVHEPVRTESKFYSGRASLAYDIENGGPSRERIVGVVGKGIGSLAPGAVITFHVFIPEIHNFLSIESFIQTARKGSWTADRRVAGQLVANQWNTFVVTVPAAFEDEKPLELGVLFLLGNGIAKATVYIDHIVFVPGP